MLNGGKLSQLFNERIFVVVLGRLKEEIRLMFVKEIRRKLNCHLEREREELADVAGLTRGKFVLLKGGLRKIKQWEETMELAHTGGKALKGQY